MRLNLTVLEYVTEVAKCGSISKAAQNLFISQPHLSNQIKAAEQQLGVDLFRRSAKGMFLTEEGRLFVQEAQSILSEVDALQNRIQVKPEKAIRSSISVTRSYQVNRCITQFINEHADKSSLALHIKETNPFQVVQDVYTKEAELGVLHIFDAQKEYFLNSFQAHSLVYQNHYQRSFLIAISEKSPLAKEKHIYKKMLEDYIIVMYGDYEIPSASYETIAKVSNIPLSHRRIYAYDRATAMEILNRCPNTYMWITGLHMDTLEQYHLKLRQCEDVDVKNLGYSIYSADTKLSWSTKALLDKMLHIDWNEDVTKP